jgi:hypothetical protein
MWRLIRLGGSIPAHRGPRHESDAVRKSIAESDSVGLASVNTYGSSTLLVDVVEYRSRRRGCERHGGFFLLLRHDVGLGGIAFVLLIPLALALFDLLDRAPDLVACFVVDANRLYAIQNVEKSSEMTNGLFV